MKVVAIIGANGGAGATTVTAHLAAALAAQNKSVLGMDFCPENFLRLHFGMLWNDGTGFAPQLLAGQPWHEAAFRSAGGVDFVPFGQLPSEAALQRLCDWFSRHPDWFGERLKEVQLPADTLVICDCPRLSATLSAQVLARADLVLVVMTPDAISYAAATQTLHAVMAEGEGAPPASIVLNAFDPSRDLDRDIAALLRTGFQRALAPVTVHRDESLREALACKQTVFDAAPSSQAAYEFSALATWVVAHVHQLRQAA